jgi:hypothetical protein
VKIKHVCREAIPGWSWADYLKQEKRAARLGTSFLLDYCDVAGTGMSKAFMDHREDGNLDSIAEVEKSIITLWAVTQELKTRAEAQLS